jgi:cell filamentation protein
LSYVQADGITLKNLLGASTHQQLDADLAPFTRRRLDEIAAGLGPEPTFDTAYLKALHGYIFQDVFEWAGHTRDERIALADGTTAYVESISKINKFADSIDIPEKLDTLFDKLKTTITNVSEPLTRSAFANRAADVLVDLNNTHPFREGNGRTQRAFMSQLARAHGFEIATDVMSKRDNKLASMGSAFGNPTPTRDLYQKLTDPDYVHAIRTAQMALSDTALDWQKRPLITTTPGEPVILEMITKTSQHFVAWAADPTNPSIVVGWRTDLPRPPPNSRDTFEITPAARPAFERPTDMWLVEPMGKRLGVSALPQSARNALAVADLAERARLIKSTPQLARQLETAQNQLDTRLSRNARKAMLAGDHDTFARLTRSTPAQAVIVSATYRTLTETAQAIQSLKIGLNRGPTLTR